MWQPIETAPKDGSSVLVTNDRGMFVASFDVEGPDDCLDRFWHVWDGKWSRDLRGSLPTHWMPLPDPPQEAQR